MSKNAESRQFDGDELRDWRNHYGMTQSELGERTGLDESTISKYESGERQPSLGAVMRLAHELGCEIEDLLE